MKIKPVWFTARQLALITQVAQAIGLVLIARGVVSNADWELYCGIGTSVAALILGWRDGGNNDENTAKIQNVVGAIPDARPGPSTVGAAIDLARKAGK